MKIVFLAVLTDIDKVLRCLTSWCASPSKTSSWRDKYLIIYSTDFFFTCLVFKLSSVGDLSHFMQRHGNLYLSQSQTSWRIIARHTWNNLIFHSCRHVLFQRPLDASFSSLLWNRKTEVWLYKGQQKTPFQIGVKSKFNKCNIFSHVDFDARAGTNQRV